MWIVEWCECACEWLSVSVQGVFLFIEEMQLNLSVPLVDLCPVESQGADKPGLYADICTNPDV